MLMFSGFQSSVPLNRDAANDVDGGETVKHLLLFVDTTMNDNLSSLHGC